MKKILFITGTRADFGKLKPLMEQIEHSPDFECYIFATGMHTLVRYGFTYTEIGKSGFTNIFLYFNQIVNNSSDMDIVLSNTIQGIGYYVREFMPDMIVVHGDRLESMAGAIVGAFNNIRVAHIEGGELSGTIDEAIRHSITKLSHLHFVSNDDARKRLIQMGEHTDSIFIIGSPEVDIMLSENLPSLSEVKQRYGIKFDEYAIFVYHSVTTELDQLKHNIEEVIIALKESGLNYIILHPNNDRGSNIILNTLKELKNNPYFIMFSSLRFEYYLTLLKHALVIVGNSSSGVREAPVYGVPSVNIGSRQKNRHKYPSIINVKEDKNSILKALHNFPLKIKPSLYFGNGNSSKKFIEILRNPTIWDISFQKYFIDL